MLVSVLDLCVLYKPAAVCHHLLIKQQKKRIITAPLNIVHNFVVNQFMFNLYGEVFICTFDYFNQFLYGRLL